MSHVKIGMNIFIGNGPYAAFRYTEGKAAMLEWTQGGDSARLNDNLFSDKALDCPAP
jgi:hypothetical protein